MLNFFWQALRLFSPCLLAFLLATSSAQSLPVKQDPEWFRMNDRGTRWEGLADHPNAKRDYEIRGFFAYRPNTEVRSSETLHLTYFVPPGIRVASILVQEIHPETQYLMELKPNNLPSISGQWNTYSDWPANTVITPKKVAVTNLGALIRLEDGSLAPALLYATPHPAVCNLPAPAPNAYSFDFVSHRELKDISCRVIDSLGATQSCTIIGPHTAGLKESIPVEFSIPFAKLSQGQNTIRLQGRYANSDSRLDAEVHFLHHPFIDPCR